MNLKEIITTRFQDQDATIADPICNQCTHLYKDQFGCEAYPDGIPKEILTGEVDHSKPYKGDHGIQFKAIEK